VFDWHLQKNAIFAALTTALTIPQKRLHEKHRRADISAGDGLDLRR